jgi:hypothetical protein
MCPGLRNPGIFNNSQLEMMRQRQEALPIASHELVYVESAQKR